MVSKPDPSNKRRLRNMTLAAITLMILGAVALAVGDVHPSGRPDSIASVGLTLAALGVGAGLASLYFGTVPDGGDIDE